MSEAWVTAEEESERRTRIASASVDERLAWLRRMQEFAYETGALQRARRKKEEEEANGSS